MSHPRNLCPTVEAHGPRYETARCTVGHPIDPYQNGGRTWTDSHEWTDHRGGYEGGTCINCGKTLKQVRVRINPKTGSAVERAIANTPRDVPPIFFKGNL